MRSPSGENAPAPATGIGNGTGRAPRWRASERQRDGVEPACGQCPRLPQAAEQHRRAVGGPAVDLVVVAPAGGQRAAGRIPRQLADLAAVARHDADLLVATDLAGEGDPAAIGRELREQLDSGRCRQPRGRATGDRGAPQVPCVGEHELVAVDIGVAQQSGLCWGGRSEHGGRAQGERRGKGGWHHSARHVGRSSGRAQANRRSRISCLDAVVAVRVGTEPAVVGFSAPTLSAMRSRSRRSSPSTRAMRCFLLLAIAVLGCGLTAQSNVVPGLDGRLTNVNNLTYWGRRGPAHPGGEVGMSMLNTMCNPGTVDIPWAAAMQENHPWFGFLIARVANDRIEQINEWSYCKHAWLSVNVDGDCGSCNDPAGPYLGPNCSDDAYGAGNERRPRRISVHREEINPWTRRMWIAVGSYFDIGDPVAVELPGGRPTATSASATEHLRRASHNRVHGQGAVDLLTSRARSTTTRMHLVLERRSGWPTAATISRTSRLRAERGTAAVAGSFQSNTTMQLQHGSILSALAGRDRSSRRRQRPRRRPILRGGQGDASLGSRPVPLRVRDPQRRQQPRRRDASQVPIDAGGDGDELHVRRPGRPTREQRLVHRAASVNNRIRCSAAAGGPERARVEHDLQLRLRLRTSRRARELCADRSRRVLGAGATQVSVPDARHQVPAWHDDRSTFAHRSKHAAVSPSARDHGRLPAVTCPELANPNVRARVSDQHQPVRIRAVVGSTTRTSATSVHSFDIWATESQSGTLIASGAHLRGQHGR